MKTHLVSCMKDEGPFILEWVAYHRAIGFDQITILSNNLTDESDRLLDALASRGFIQHFSVTVPEGQFPQQAGYAFLAKKEGYFADDDWIMVLDGDEFLNVHVGDGSVRAFIDAVAEDNDIIVVQFANFGDKGQPAWEPGFVTEQYRYRAPIDHRVNRGVKSLFHGMHRFHQLDNHHPSRLRAGQMIKIRFPTGEVTDYGVIDGPLYRIVRDMDPKFRSFAHAQVNHYLIKSYDSFYFKRIRGRGWGNTERHNDAFFIERSDACTEFDETINNKLARMHQFYDEMIAIPQIRDEQERQFENYQKRIDGVNKALLDGENLQS